MRRIIVATLITLSLTLAACSPYDPPAAAEPATTTTTTVAPACDQACIYRYAHAVETARIHRVYAYAAAVERARVARIYAFAAAVERARLARLAYPAGQCGGSLPPCYVMRRESGGDPRIWNGGCYAPIGWTGKSPCGSSSASGKWQAIRSSWARFGGYLNAADAPESVQDTWARRLYAGGRGGSHWGM